MFRDVYDVTACVGHQMKEVITGLEKQWLLYSRGTPSQLMPITKEALRLDSPYSLPSVGLNDDDIYGYVFLPGDITLAPFAHPLLISKNSSPKPVPGEDGIYVIDGRGFIAMNRGGLTYRLTSGPTNDLSRLRLKLQKMWATQDPHLLLDLGSYQVTVYSRWVTESLIRRFGVGPDTQMLVGIIVSYFYMCQFEPTSVLQMYAKDTVKMETFKHRCATVIARANYVKYEQARELIDRIENPITNAAELMLAINTHGDNMRLDKLDRGFLYTTIGSSWTGTNSRELCHTALEHPPTFLAMLAQGLLERGWKHTGIGRIALEQDKTDVGRAFISNITSLINRG